MCAGKSGKGTNCQCDGNCQCGKVVAPGIVSCADCGWKVTKAFDPLYNQFVYPSLRVESSFSNVKPNNINQMNNQDLFPSQGLVALGTGLPGGLWGVSMAKNPYPIGNESSFVDSISSQKTVGYGIGQDWVLLDPFKNGNIQESGFNFGEKLRNAFVRFTPAGALVRDSYCGKYCKSLGYMRSADKNAFKRCKASCKINYINALKGAWTYPVAPEGAEESLTPEELAAMSQNEANSMPPAQKNAAMQNAANEDASDASVLAGAGAAPAKSNMLMYVLIGVVVLAIIIAIILMMRKRQQAA